ncbi:sensor histidine kinase [Sphingomonas sp. J344]|nr:sensor histidine kinase [Sphingomonas sp. J344]MCR5869506.1 sensor histidine kinase [Sphingomonas sp. J344]
MAKEIDHRVMNSLQFVSSLLSMQSRALTDPDTVGHLQLAANRVAAVAQVHRHFYVEATDQTSCITFLRRLCAELASILDREIDVSGDEGVIPTTIIQPIGLLVNELVTNAAKHGRGLIQVRYEIEANQHALIVSDDGRDLPKDFDPTATSQSLGMRVVVSLARQLGGVLTSGHRPDGGTCFKVSFEVQP